MIDVVHQIDANHRSVTGGEAVRMVTVTRTYDATIEELWDACTNPERIARWFLPVTGDLRVGGTYQLEGNAGGTIRSCDPPHRFDATWEFDGKVSWIAVAIAGAGAHRARFTLEHTVPVDEHWSEYGPSAVGVGWDLGLLGLTLHLDAPDGEVDREAVGAWMATDDARDFMVRSSRAWHDAHVAGGADAAEDAAAQAERTLAAYTATEG